MVDYINAQQKNGKNMFSRGDYRQESSNTKGSSFGNICIIFVLIFELLTQFMTPTTQHA